MRSRRRAAVAATLVAVLALGGCDDDAVPPASVPAGAEPPLPPYDERDLVPRLTTAMARAGTVRYTVDLSDGRAARGQADLGRVTARRLRISLPETADARAAAAGRHSEYLGLGRITCVSRSVVRALVASSSGGLRMPRSSLPWNCVRDRGSVFAVWLRNVRQTFDPLDVVAALDPWQEFELLGVEDTDGGPVQHLRVATSWLLDFRPAEVWIDESGLPVRLEWAPSEDVTATALLQGWGEAVDLALPPSAERTEDEPRHRPWRVGSRPSSPLR